jgi:hypothetical protein
MSAKESHIRALLAEGLSPKEIKAKTRISLSYIYAKKGSQSISELQRRMTIQDDTIQDLRSKVARLMGESADPVERMANR